MPDQIKSTPSQAEGFAFAHLQDLSAILHADGHRSLALLLDGMGDLHELARRRVARGAVDELLPARNATVDYVLEQLRDLASLMDQHGLGDAALLMRTPARLQACADLRRQGEAPQIFVLPYPSSDASTTKAIPASVRKVG